MDNKNINDILDKLNSKTLKENKELILELLTNDNLELRERQNIDYTIEQERKKNEVIK